MTAVKGCDCDGCNNCRIIAGEKPYKNDSMKLKEVKIRVAKIYNIAVQEVGIDRIQMELDSLLDYLEGSSNE